MIVILEEELFTSPANVSSLLAIFRLGAEGRHRVQTDPLYSDHESPFGRWIDGLGNQILREEVRLALDIGAEQDALGLPADLSVRVGHYSASIWKGRTPRLPINAALRLLQDPLSLLVENRHNDGAFLRAVAPSTVRKGLEKALEHGWVKIDHGGGADMKAHIKAVSPAEAHRLWVLSDSDAREPDRPSDFQQDFSELCDEKGVRQHRLLRRASENYLPVKALIAWWVYSGPKGLQTERRQVTNAFARLRPDQRHHYNMKSGFSGDRPNISRLFADCADHRHLQGGFGEAITALFQQQIPEDWLRRDGQYPETLEMVQSILRRL